MNSKIIALLCIFILCVTSSSLENPASYYDVIQNAAELAHDDDMYQLQLHDFMPKGSVIFFQFLKIFFINLLLR